MITYLNSHLLEAPCEYVRHGLNSGLDWAPLMAVLPKCISCLPWFIQYLAVCPNGSGFASKPFIAVRWLLTNVQVSNITTLHDTHGHTYIHHIGITIPLLFYTSSTLLGRGWPRPFPSDTVCIHKKL
jgi:hypothetical protein